jgi:hypothetical protein
MAHDEGRRLIQMNSCLESAQAGLTRRKAGTRQAIAQKWRSTTQQTARLVLLTVRLVRSSSLYLISRSQARRPPTCRQVEETGQDEGKAGPIDRLVMAHYFTEGSAISRAMRKYRLRTFFKGIVSRAVVGGVTRELQQKGQLFPSFRTFARKFLCPAPPTSSVRFGWLPSKWKAYPRT